MITVTAQLSFLGPSLLRNFYGNRIVDAWNNLPNTVVSAPSTDNFKRKLREVNLDRY